MTYELPGTPGTTIPCVLTNFATPNPHTPPMIMCVLPLLMSLFPPMSCNHVFDEAGAIPITPVCR
jgi:hypothetical protein